MLKIPSFNVGLITFLFVLLLSSLSLVSAHQPRLDTQTTVSVENPILVDNPEISQAFYGQLNGKPVYYQIQSTQPFQLYLNLLVPTSPGQGGEPVSAEVTDSSGKVVMFLNGTTPPGHPTLKNLVEIIILRVPKQLCRFLPGPTTSRCSTP